MSDNRPVEKPGDKSKTEARTPEISSAQDEAARLLTAQGDKKTTAKAEPAALPMDWAPITAVTKTTDRPGQGSKLQVATGATGEAETKAKPVKLSGKTEVVNLSIPASAPEMPPREARIEIAKELAGDFRAAVDSALKASANGAGMDAKQAFFNMIFQQPYDFKAPLIDAARAGKNPAMERVINEAYQVKSKDTVLLQADQIKNPEVKARMISLVGSFEQRARRDGLSSHEIGGTYDSVNRILGQPGSRNLTDSQRQTLAEQVLLQAAKPETILSGDALTNPVAVLEQRVYTQHPAAASKLVADMAMSGTFTTADGASLYTNIWPDAGALQYDLTMNMGEVDVKSHDHRSWASQIFQNTAVNAKYERDFGNDETHTSVYRFQKIEDKDGKEKDVLVRYGVDEHGQPTFEKFSDFPYIQPEDLTKINRLIVGNGATGTENGFAILGPVVEGENDQLLKMTQDSYKTGAAKVVESAAELTEHLRTIGAKGGLPASILVSGTHPMFAGADGTVPGGTQWMTIRREKEFQGESYVEYNNNGKSGWLKTADLFKLTMPTHADGNSAVEAPAVDNTRARSPISYDVSKDVQRHRETALDISVKPGHDQSGRETGNSVTMNFPTRDGSGQAKPIDVALAHNLMPEFSEAINLAYKASSESASVQNTADWFAYANEHPIALKQALTDAAQQSGDPNLLRIVREAYSIKDVAMIDAPPREALLSPTQSQKFNDFIAENSSLLADPRSYASFRVNLFNFLNNDPEMREFAKNFGASTEHSGIAGALDYYFGTENVNRFGLVTAVDAMGGRRTMSVTGKILEARTPFGDSIYYDRQGQVSSLVLKDGSTVEEKTPGNWVSTTGDGKESSSWWNGKLEAEPDGSLRFTDADGKVFVKRFDNSTETLMANGRVQYEELDHNIERLVAQRLAGRFQDADAGKRFEALIQKFESRVASSNVSEFQAAQTYHQVRRLLEMPNSRGLSARQTEMLAEQIMFNAAYSSTPSNGWHTTCIGGALERRIYDRNPGEAARLVVDMVIDGQYVGTDGSVVRQAIAPDMEAQEHRLELNGENVRFNGRRGWASQIFQTATSNMAHIDPAADPASESFRFTRVENYRGGEMELLVRHGDGKIEGVTDNPWIHNGTIESLEAKITGSVNADGQLVNEKKGFVVMGPTAYDSEGKLVKVTDAHFPNGSVKVMQNAEQFLNYSKQLQAEGNFPMVLVVSRTHAELANADGVIQNDMHTLTVHNLVQQDGVWYFEYADGEGGRDWMRAEDMFRMTTVNPDPPKRVAAQQRPERQAVEQRNVVREQVDTRPDGTRQIIDPRTEIGKLGWTERLTDEELRGFMEAKRQLEERVRRGESLNQAESDRLETLRYIEQNVYDRDMHQQVIEQYGNRRPAGGFKASQLASSVVAVGFLAAALLQSQVSEAAPSNFRPPRARFQ